MAKDGAPGKDGTDGQDMRPNLLDYTEFKQETFDNVPNPDKTFALEGTRAEGLNGHGAVQVETAFKINGDLPTPDSYVDFFQQNVKSKIAPSTWYTLSFYLKSKSLAQPLYTYMWTYDTNGLTMVDTTEKMIVDGKEQDTPKDGAVKFPPIHEWTYHTVTFKTAANLPDTCLCLFRAISKQIPQNHPIIPCVYVTEPKLEVGKAASAWTRSDNDIAGIAADKINMPSWVRQWDGQTTELGADYVAAKNAAFGTKDADGKFTGIAMSGEGFDLGGKDTNVVGLYGVYKDECRVIIDPKNDKYWFRGNILCESGQVNGLLVGSYLKGLTQVTNDTEWKKAFTLKGSYYRPNFFVINPIVILSYDIGDKRTLSLPPYGNNANDYAESIAFLDYKFYIINKMSQVLNQNIIDIKTGIPGALYKKDSTMSSGKSSISTYRLNTGKAVILTGCIEENGSFYWLVEEGSTSSDLGSGIIEKPSFTIKDNTNIGQMTWTKVPLAPGPSDNGTIKP